MAINLGSTAVADFKLGDTQVDKICLGDTVVWQKVQLKALKFSSTGAQTLGVVTANLGSVSPNFEYSTDDGATWTSWDVSQTIGFGNGTDLYLRGMNTFLAKQGNNYVQFTFSTTSPVECSGNVMHLFDYTQDLTTFPDTSSSARGLKRLFRDATQLVSAPELGATDLTGVQWAYEYMFSGCTALTTAPDLPATTLANNCYQYMFSGCTALTTAPDLPATTLANNCYQYMFSGCTALTTAPDLPATLITAAAYEEMFKGCSSLVNAPAIKASISISTTTGWFFGSMFEDCVNLESLPLLRVPYSSSYQYAAYQQMFKGCAKIKMSLTQDSEYVNEYVLPSGVTNTSAALDMFTGTGGTFTGTPTQQTLYTSNTIVS